MHLNVSSSLLISEGKAELQFPPVFKREPLQATIQCNSLCFMDNAEALNEPFFIVCSGSTYYTRDSKVKYNILGMFQNKLEANIVTFGHSVPLTAPQENLTIEIVDQHGDKQKVSALGVFTIDGFVNNRLLAI